MPNYSLVRTTKKTHCNSSQQSTNSPSVQPLASNPTKHFLLQTHPTPHLVYSPFPLLHLAHTPNDTTSYIAYSQSRSTPPPRPRRCSMWTSEWTGKVVGRLDSEDISSPGSAVGGLLATEGGAGGVCPLRPSWSHSVGWVSNLVLPR